jgi:hypothetical protein
LSFLLLFLSLHLLLLHLLLPLSEGLSHLLVGLQVVLCALDHAPLLPVSHLVRPKVPYAVAEAGVGDAVVNLEEGAKRLEGGGGAVRY